MIDEITRTIRAGNAKRLRVLLNDGLDPNTRSAGLTVRHRQSLLYWAVFFENYEIVKLLIENGADVNQDNILHMAINRDNLDIIGILLSHNANYLAKCYGANAIEEAIICGKRQNLIHAIEIIGIDKIIINPDNFYKHITERVQIYDNYNQVILDIITCLEICVKLNLIHFDLELLKETFKKPCLEKLVLFICELDIITKEELNIACMRIENSYKKVIENYLLSRRNRAESRMANIMFSYKDDLPDVLRDRIVSFVY